jgi:hypothetical protein
MTRLIPTSMVLFFEFDVVTLFYLIEAWQVSLIYRENEGLVNLWS